MDITSLIITLLIGAAAGWIAGQIMKGRGFGAIGNIIVGIIGAILGGFLLGMVGIGLTGLVGTLLKAVIGAVVLLFLIGLIKK